MPREIDLESLRHGTELLKRGFAKMQKGGVIMDVTNAEQAGIAEDAGAVAVMALERVPADIRASGGVARMADPSRIKEIMGAVTIPVMAKCRIGHFVEAQALEALGVDMVDESEVLTPADPFFHVDKPGFTIPFVCGARELGEAVRRIYEGAAMVRTKGEAGTGNVIEAVRHQRLIAQSIRAVVEMDREMLASVSELFAQRYMRLRTEVSASLGTKCETIGFGERTFGDLTGGILKVLEEVRDLGRLPVVNFAAGGIATPCDAALMMQLGSDGVFVGSGIFKSEEPARRARAIVEAVAHYDDPVTLAEVSRDLGEAMRGEEISHIPPELRMQERGV